MGKSGEPIKARTTSDHHGRNKKGKYALLPCGKCEYCRKQMAEQWATRIELEAKEWDDVIFLTLTYDDEHIPYGEIVKGYQSIQSQTVS